jgi:propane monooxygenase coupling protein
MSEKPGIKLTEMSAAIRVDGEQKIEFNFAEIAEALGWDEGDFRNDDFEEIMTTHYGRMVVFDDRILLFANPEDAGEHIGFDLVAR